MSSKLKPIVDPEDKKAKPIELPEKMRMRNLQTCEAKPGQQPVNTQSLPSLVSEDKVKGLPHIGQQDSTIECFKLADKVLDSIDSIDNHKGFTIGTEKNKIYCGSVIQRIPKGGYARIIGGQSVFSASAPIEKKPKMTFQFDRKRQLAIKVGNNVGQDWVVVVAGNGCVFLDTGSYASFEMPIYIVEQKRHYYKVGAGNRILLLGTGHHLMLYTKECPILFVRKHTVTHQKSIPVTAIPPQQLVHKIVIAQVPPEPKKKEEPKKEEPKKEDSKEDLKEVSKEDSKEDSKDEQKPVPPVAETIEVSKNAKIQSPSVEQLEVPEEADYTKAKIIGLIAATAVIGIALLYLIFGAKGRNSQNIRK